ncbi:hypothetical protein BU15DRAFT_68528 [Melanogaster broomeanus]|nr:hypothetical protein BU15DRAFT_68528 [Melanogaster broomeanus]
MPVYPNSSTSSSNASSSSSNLSPPLRQAHPDHGITIHPFLLARIHHLKSAHDGFKTLSKLFEKPAPTPTTTYNIRTVADTRQKPSEGSCNVRDRETATNKAESAIVEEPHDVRCRKHERDTGSHGRVETWGREGKRAAGCMSEQGAAARGPGEGVTDLKASGIGLAIMPSSQEDDTGVRCTPVIPQEPQMTSGRAGDASAGAVNPRATSARPTEPAGASHNPPGRAARDSGQRQCEGREANNRVDKGERRASEKVAAARGPGEDAMDQTADGMSLRASMPLEGERDSQATSGSTRAHSEGAEPPDGTADAQDGTQTQRCAKGTRTGQQHHASAHGEGCCARAEWPSSVHERNSFTMSGSTRVPEGIIEHLGGRAEPSMIVEDPGGRVKPSTQADRPPSTPLEGERGHQPSSGYTDDRTIAHEHRDESEVELEGGRMHTSVAPPNASATRAVRGGARWLELDQPHPREKHHTAMPQRQAAKGTHQEATEWAGSTTMSMRPRTAWSRRRQPTQAKPGTGVMKTVSVSDPSSSKVLSLADSDLYSSVSSGAHEESPESGGDSAFRVLSGSSNGGDTQEKCPNGNSNAATASNQAQHTRNVTSRPKTYHLAPKGARPIRNISHKPNGTGDRR